MNKIFLVVIIVISVLITLSVLIQNQGSSVGGMFGNDSSVHHAKRGFDKAIFIFTLILSIALICILVLNLVY